MDYSELRKELQEEVKEEIKRQIKKGRNLSGVNRLSKNNLLTELFIWGESKKGAEYWVKVWSGKIS